MTKKYIVALSQEERAYLEDFSKTGRHAAYQITRARILLKADSNQTDGGWADEQISEALDVGVSTIERLRRRLVECGLQASLQRGTGGGCKRTFDGNQEAHLIALRYSAAPPSQAQWTLRLLADQMVSLEYVETISHETVRKILKKTSYSLGNSNVG